MDYSSAYYEWPNISDSEISVIKFGDYNHRLRIALMVLPHSNEPLGTAVISFLDGISKEYQCPLVLINNIDPPIKPQNCFPLPGNFFDFLLNFHMPLISKQVEFSYTDTPNDVSQFRSKKVCEYLLEHKINQVLAIHNDMFRSIGYFYAHEKLDNLEWIAQKFNLSNNCPEELNDVLFTHKLSPLVYSYFPAKNIDPHILTESLGFFIYKQLGINIITLECPIFNWNNIQPTIRAELFKLYQFFIFKQIAIENRHRYIDSRIEKIAREIHMIPASSAARFQVDVLKKIIEDKINNNKI